MLTKLDQLHSKIFNCELCDLSKERDYVVVKRGSNNSKLMIVADVPGELENDSGIPFLGDPGALLERILASVEISSEDAYITYAVKCSVQSGEKPNQTQIKTCKPWLIQQIESLEPKVLVFLGANTYTNLLGSKWILDKSAFGITKYRGQWFETEWCKNTICTFHPTYMLHNWKLDEGSPKYLAWKDWISIKERLVDDK